MTFTQRYLQPEQLAGAVGALGLTDAPMDGRMRAAYTRQTPGEWTFFMGQCVLVPDRDADLTEVYPTFAFVSKAIRKITLNGLLDSVAQAGLEVAPGLPPIRCAVSPQTWNEEIAPSYVTRSRLASRRFTASMQRSAFFPDGQLVDFALPYRPSAGRYLKEFFGLKAFYGPSDARNGGFFIEVPDRRGAIRFAGGLISISDPTVELRLVGQINGEIEVSLKNDGVFEYDEKTVREVELWLVTKDNELVDYISTTNWPHKYEVPQEAQKEERMLDMIRRGESEMCEFKPHVDLSNQKASEIEKTVCAFSNQRGGMLFIGVNDEGDIIGLAKELLRRGRMKGQDIETLAAEYEKDVRRQIQEALKDNQCFTSAVMTISGTRVIVVEVQPSSYVNFFVKSDLAQMAYIRHGATNARMSPPEIKAKGGNDVNSVLRNQVFGS